MKVMWKKVTGCFLCLLLLIGLMPVNMVKGDNVPVVNMPNTSCVSGNQYSIVRVTGSSTNGFTITANENEDITVILSGVTINAGPALRILGTGNVTILLEGNNTLISYSDAAGISKENSGSLIISSVEGSQSASLNIEYYRDGAGIGGGRRGSGSNIMIGGNAQVTINHSGGGAGIGGGSGGSGSNITIGDNAQVTVNHSGYGAGIGGGDGCGSGSDITIGGNAQVTVNHSGEGAGIGGGDGGSGSDITIDGNAQVTVNHSGKGAGIGGGFCGSCYDITIGDNANVIVVGGEESAAIGGSLSGLCERVRILDNATVRLGLYDDNRPYIGGRNWTDIEFTNNSHPTFTGDVLYYEPGATVQAIQNGPARRVNTANLSLKANGGTGNDVVVTRPIGVSGVIPNNTFSRAGHTFSKWNTAANGNGTNYTAWQSVTLTQDLTLYAVWEHVYNQNDASAQYLKNVADCTHAAVYYKSCVCGARGTDNDTFTQGSPLGHDYHEVPGTYTAPTCTKEGKEADRECNRCHNIVTGAAIAKLPHTYDREDVAPEYLKSVADCTNPAVYYRSCTCGARGTDNDTFTQGSPLGHDYHEVPGTYTAPTCTKEGKEADRECSRCHNIVTGAAIAKLPHTYDREDVSPEYLKSAADCTNPAVYYRSCTCGARGTDNDTFTQGSPLGHDYQEVPGTYTAPTCTTAGKEADRECSRCHTVITGGTIDSLPHTYDRTVASAQYLKTAADCTHAAVYYKSCVCGARGTETFTYGNPLGHDYHDVPGTYAAPTCTTAGKEADRECSRCHNIVTGAAIAKLPHTYDREVVSPEYLKSAADCTNPAVYYRSCTCGARGTDNDTFTQGSPLGHDYHYVPGSYESASCTSSGKESDRECSRCHDVIYGSYIPVLPHTYDREVVNATYLKSDADCIHSAVYYKSCICGECGTETFTSGSPLGHFYQEVSESSIAPTCTSEGKEADQSCLRCGDVITGAVIAKLPHTFDQKTASDKYLKTSADCTHEAVYYMSCSCGEKGTETFIHGNALGHDYKEVIGSEVAPCCTSEGKERDLKCTRCQDVITGAVIARLPHTFELRKAEDKYLKTPADCTHEAVYYMSCTCGEKGTETFTYGFPLGHDYKVLAETYKAPTCAEPGKEADMECARCHDLIMGKSIPKTEDHKWKEATGWNPRTCEICGLTEGDVVNYRISVAENAGTSDNSKGLTYKKGEKTPLILKLLRSEDEGSVIDHLEGILIDDKEAKYTTDRYDNSVSIAYENLNSLEAGEHTITVVFNDWREELKLTIEPAVTPKDLVIPIAVVGSLSLAGGLGTAIIVRKRKALK